MTIAIGMMCKAPRAGFSKTRLAGHVGTELAARLSAAFLRDVGASLASACEADGGIAPYALFCPADAEGELRRHLPGGFEFMLMHEGDLGTTMLNAIKALLARGHEGAILIGSDFPTLPAAILIEAAMRLRAPGTDAVIGPSLDGGYYLIGMRAPQETLFLGMTWSTSTVFGDTMEQAAKAGLHVAELPVWYDVDDAASFALLQDHLAGRAIPALNGSPPPSPAIDTRRVLGNHDLAGHRTGAAVAAD
jgi:rSAM/selenodomain-associated transferase 1